jgi:phosphopantothenoylcysteine decarboxylase/phosphopantothenate--cysteine ligase
MWQHPATQRNIQKLRGDGVHIIEPDAGEMACGTIGPGRLSAPERIVSAALEILATVERRTDAPVSLGDLANERIVITAGATREQIDPVRFISNRSSGKMGFALAEAARQRGADVRVVAGITTVAPPAGVHLIQAASAEEMHAAVLREVNDATIFIAAAAVADYRPKKSAKHKIKKTSSELTLELERTPDILAEVARRRKAAQTIVGFAAETENLIANARKKLEAKQLDIMVANDVSRAEFGFDSETNAVTILSKDRSDPLDVPPASKLEVANRILDEITRLRAQLSTATSA